MTYRDGKEILCESNGKPSHKASRAGDVQQICPHCSGLHYGQGFDACPYVALVTDPAATEDQRKNAAE